MLTSSARLRAGGRRQGQQGPRRASRAALLLTVLVTVLPTSGCKRTGPGPEHPYTVALVGPVQDHPVWPAVQAGARAFAQQYRTVQVLTAAPERETGAAQRKTLEMVADQGANAVAIWPVDAEMVAGPIDILIGRGVPVVTIGVDVPGSNRVGFVGWDEQQVGQALADLAAQQIRDSRTLMVLHGGDNRPHLRQRLEALQTALRRHPRLAVLAEIDCQSVPQKARQIITERMDRYPRLGGWISIDDWPLRGLAQPESILPAGCAMISCHPGPAYWSMLESGRGGLVGTDYFDWGWRGILLCYSALRSVPLELPTYHTAVIKVSSANLGEWRQRWEGWLQPGAAASSRHTAE